MINTNIELINEIRNVKNNYDMDTILSSNTYAEYLKSQALIALGKVSEMRSVDFEIIANKQSSTTAYTNGDKITNNVLCPMVQRVDTLADKDRINQGKMFHEIGHRFFTDFKSWNNVFQKMEHNGEWYPNTEPEEHEFYEEVTRNLKYDPNYRKTMFSLYKRLMNIYEDEYIEKCMINVIGGEFLRSLQFTRQKVVEHQIPMDECIKNIKAGKSQFLVLLMNSLLVYASHGELLGCEGSENDAIYQELQKELDRCKKYSEKLSIETDTIARIQLCNYLLCELHRYIKVEQKKSQGSSKQDQRSNLDDIDQSMESDLQQSSIMPQGDSKPIDPNKIESNSMNPNHRSESSKLEDLYERLAEENLEKKASQELRREAKEIYLKQVQKSGFVDWHYIVERDLEISEQMIKTYDNYHQEIQPYALKTKRLLAKVLNDRKLEGLQKGYTIGRFNTASYIDQLYSNTGRSFSKNLAPCEKLDVVFGLVIDESGSMEGNKIKMAKRSAILFEDVLSSMNIPHMILGHTGYQDKSYLFMYHDFNNFDKKDKYRLINLRHRNRNRDGATIKYACEKLKNREEKHKILIVITDGAPTEIGFHHCATEEDDVRLTVKEESKDILIFGAVIDGEMEAMEYMYKDRVLDLTDLEKLPNALCKLIKRNIY